MTFQRIQILLEAMVTFYAQLHNSIFSLEKKTTLSTAFLSWIFVWLTVSDIQKVKKKKIHFLIHCHGRKHRESRYLELMFLLMTRLKCRSNKLSHDDISLSGEQKPFHENEMCVDLISRTVRAVKLWTK